MAPASAATILHADLDAFYASVEELLDPSLRGTPFAVGGGVVLSPSYAARRYGVSSGMSAWRARRLCPDLRFVGGHFHTYTELGDQVMAIFGGFTPAVERVSIDEAFLDVTGAVRLFGPPVRIAGAIRQRVRREVGLPISVGVARTKHLAKIASQVAKPDGLVVVEPDKEMRFLHRLPISLVWGVGPKTEARLEAVGVRTIGQLAATSPDGLQTLLGRAIGTKLSLLAGNVDPRQVTGAARVRSVSAQSALGRQTATPEVVRTTLGFLADRVGARLREAQKAGHTLTVRVRFPDMQAVTRASTFPVPMSATRTLAEIGTDLVLGLLAERDEHEVTLLGLAVSRLRPESAIQLELPLDFSGTGTIAHAARWSVDRSVDTIRARFGRGAVGYAGAASGEAGVPDAFRELAEREVH